MTESAPKKGLRIRERLGRAIAGGDRRVADGWDRLHKEAGFIPILNVTDTEARRQEVKTILDKSRDALFDIEKQKSVCKDVYSLFFSAGNPWYRGLDNRELAKKVAYFLENYTVLGDMDEFIPDLFEESMQLLSLSWQALDVTHTPVYIIESRPLISPSKGSPDTVFDDMVGLHDSLEELKKKQESEETKD
jgi:hypothetical protein